MENADSKLLVIWFSLIVCLLFVIKLFRWYVKAHEINPKNGKPYNQLALLAVYAVSCFNLLLFLHNILMLASIIVPENIFFFLCTKSYFQFSKCLLFFFF